MTSRLPVFFGGLLVGGGVTWAGGAILAVFLSVLAVLLASEIFLAFRRSGAPWHCQAPVQLYGLSGILAFYLLRREGLTWPVAALMTVVIADTAAYLVGKRWGRTPLLPSVSPAKTLEGAAAGVILTSAVIGVFLHWHPGLSWPLGVSLGLGLALLAVLGDLLESWIKRRLGLKDFGSILPGHGGIFDRIDSIVAVSLGLWAFTRMVRL